MIAIAMDLAAFLMMAVFVVVEVTCDWGWRTPGKTVRRKK